MGDACCAHDDHGEVDDGAEPQRFWEIGEVRAAGAAGVLLVGGLIADVADAEGMAVAVFLAALVVGGSTFVPETLRALVRRRLGVGTLMTIAAAGAVALGEFGEAASLAFLFSISEALEGYALARTRRGLRALLSLVPDRVTVRRGDGELDVSPDELEVGDVMIVGPGDRIATDGTIVRGRSTLDLSAITGESVPIEVEPGTDVFAASINGGGVLEVQVTARTSVLHQITSVLKHRRVEREAVSEQFPLLRTVQFICQHSQTLFNGKSTSS